MAYCTTADLVALTDATLDITTLTAVITESDIEIDSYLNARGVTGVACAELKAASLKLSNAGLIMRNPLGTEGSGVAMTVNIMRKAAFEMLDNYLTVNTTPGKSVPRISIVRNCMNRGY